MVLRGAARWDGEGGREAGREVGGVMARRRKW